MELEFSKLEFHMLFFFFNNQQISIHLKISNFFFFHFNTKTYVFIYLNRSIVKYRNFDFQILIFRPLIPLVHSFLTHSSISNFSDALWSNWLKYWGLQWEIEQHVKEKSHSIFSHGHTERSLNFFRNRIGKVTISNLNFFWCAHG